MTRTSVGVAEEVRSMMGRKQLRGADLARTLGISQPQISYRVRGKVAWSLDELDELAGLFGCDVRDLLPQHESGRPTLSKRHGLYLVRPDFHRFSGLRNAA